MVSPWPDVSTARRFLNHLAAGELEMVDNAIPVPDKLASWLITRGLGPLVYQLAERPYPGLAKRLRDDAFSVLAENSLHFQQLRSVQKEFARAGLSLVLFKGAALAELAYGGIGLRPMADVDIWVGEEQMAQAAMVMAELGFKAHIDQKRPLPLQALAKGEILFLGPDGLSIDVHWSPFPGWWLKRVANIDEEGVWSRIDPLPLREVAEISSHAGPDRGASTELPSASFYHLAAEDAVIQLALHNAVSHQLGSNALRGLMDIVLTARARPVDWQVVAQRARHWRVNVTTWLVLDLADRLIGLEEARPALAELRPSRLRRFWLRKLVSPESVLAGTDYRTGRARYLLLLLLVDRPRDMLKLVFRTIWPEKEWMEARYGGRHGRAYHLWNLLRYGDL